MFVIENKFRGANTPRTIRFTEELFQSLTELSNEHEISFNLLVLQCCQYALENMEPPKEA